MTETATIMRLAQLTGVLGSSILSGTYLIPPFTSSITIKPTEPPIPHRPNSQHIAPHSPRPDPRRHPRPRRHPPMVKNLRPRRRNCPPLRHPNLHLPRLSRNPGLYLVSRSHGSVPALLFVCCSDVVGAGYCAVYADCYACDERSVDEVGEGRGGGGVGAGWEGGGGWVVADLEEVESCACCDCGSGCAVCGDCGGLVLMSWFSG